MTRTELILLLAAVGAGVAAVCFWRLSAPATTASAKAASGSAGALGPLSDPTSLAVGTSSTDGKWYVDTNRQGVKFWRQGTNVYTNPESIALAQALLAPKVGDTQ